MKKVVNFLTILTISLSISVLVAHAQTFGAGNDFWITDSSNTYDDVNLPANAIAPGSLAYQGRVYLKGDPQNGNPFDTSIRREQSVTVPGSTTLKVDELNMVSVNPLQVNFSDGSTRDCDMYVTKSPSVSSKGTMSIKNDGTFSSTLNIVPKLTFACTSGLRSDSNDKTITVLDTGSPLIQAMMRKQADDATKRIEAGNISASDLAKAQACVEPVPTERQTNPKATDDRSPSPEPQPGGCGIKFSAGGPWTTCDDNLAGGGFCIPVPIGELAALARHGVIPRWLGPL